MLNKTILQGRLVRDVELRRTQSGTAVASFTVAWSEKYNERETKVFLPCVAWKDTAEMVARWFAKGQEILVEGKLTTRQWEDKSGNKRETVELVVDRVHFCGPKVETMAAPPEAPAAQQFEEITEDDEQLPF